ncbi:MAG: thiol:disulfide interchange protein DsbA/DsbL [Steroidobacteraceae bacterium]
MRAGKASLLLGLALALCACGRQGPAGRTENAPAPAAAPTSGQPEPAPAARNKSALDSGRRSTLARLNEDGSETVEETTGDSGAHNPLLAAVASTVAAAAPAASAAALPASSPWQDGVNYTRLVPAQPTSVAAGQVEVLEFFWYACPHCYAIDPLVESWEKSKPSYISFSRVPVLWNEGHRSLARLYYTLQSMGKLNQFHDEIFKEIQVNSNPLIGNDPNNAAQAERVQLAFIKKLGIPEADFEKAYHSFDVEKSMQRADELVQRYRVNAVPAFVVNGKYFADVGTAGSQERLIAEVADLAALEHKR